MTGRPSSRMEARWTVTLVLEPLAIWPFVGQTAMVWQPPECTSCSAKGDPSVGDRAPGLAGATLLLPSSVRTSAAPPLMAGTGGTEVNTLVDAVVGGTGGTDVTTLGPPGAPRWKERESRRPCKLMGMVGTLDGATAETGRWIGSPFCTPRQPK